MMKRVAWAGLLAFAVLLVAPAAVAAASNDPGVQMLKTEKYRGAKATFEAALKKNPDDAAATANMAKWALATGNNKQAVDWADKATALAPDNADYQILLGFADSNYVNDVSIFRKLGIAHKILAAFKKAVELAPDSADAHGSLASYYLSVPSIAGGDVDAGQREIATLKKLAPAQAEQLLAGLASKDDKPKQAEAHLHNAVKLDHSGGSSSRLGLFLVNQQRFDEAIAAFQHGIDTAPDDSTNYYQLGRAAVLGKVQVTQGIAALTRYLAMPHSWQPGTPSYAWAHYRLGELYQLAGDKPAAKSQYQAALARNADFPEAKKALAGL